MWVASLMRAELSLACGPNLWCIINTFERQYSRHCLLLTCAKADRNKRVSGLSAHFEPQSNYYEFLILSMELVIQVFTVSVLNAHEISLCSFLLRCVIE